MTPKRRASIHRVRHYVRAVREHGPGEPPDDWALFSPKLQVETGGLYTLRFTVPRLPLLNSAAHRRWSVLHREAQEWRTFIAVCVGRRAPLRPLERARVVCTRRSTREPDADNLAWSFKPIFDALVRSGVLVDDSPVCVIERTYHWEPAPRGAGSIVIVVEEVMQP